MKKREWCSFAAAFVLCFALLSGSWAIHRQTELASRMLRLHVVAHSDTEADQRLKLEVRDAVLRRCGDLLAGEHSLASARDMLAESLPELAQAGAQVVRTRQKNYPVRVRMEYALFPATQYEGFALPAGRYQALRVELGEAKGHNWWCVLFPSLCLVGEEELSAAAMAQGLTEDDVALLRQEQPRYELRWRCVELWEELRAALER
jgi:stage II sporulation protein R